MKKRRTRSIPIVAASLLLLLVSGCGGDCIQIGGVGGCDVDKAQPATPAPPPEIFLTGTAATGLAISGGYIQAKCRDGYGWGFTHLDGNFTVRVENGVAPCVVRVTNPADASSLHTVVALESASTPFSITPLTNLASGRVLGQSPAEFFEAFDAQIAFQRIRPVAITSAQEEVKNIFGAVLNVEDLGNFMTTRVKAASVADPNGGDAVDKALDTLKRQFTVGQIRTLEDALISGDQAEMIRQNALEMVVSNTRYLIADAGVDQSAVVGNPVILDGSASKSTGSEPIIYSWEMVTRPIGSNASLNSTLSARTTFAPDLPGSYVINLVVNNGRDPGSSDMVTVVARPVNILPTAVAGPSRTVVVGQRVQLDGSGSFDPNGDALQFSWVMAGRPSGSGSVLEQPTSVSPSFVADVRGTYTIRLVVRDSIGFGPQQSVVKIVAF